MTETEAKLIATTAEIILTKGVPTFIEFIKNLHSTNKQVPTIEDIEKAKGDLDSASYFEWIFFAGWI